MNIIEATKILHDSAEANGRKFSEEVINIGDNLKSVPDEIHTAWTVWHESANDYMSHSFNKARIEELARDYKDLSLDPESIKYFDSLV